MQALASVPTSTVPEARERGLSDLSNVALVKSKYKCENGLLEFVKQSWHLVEPEHPFTCNWHVEVLCRLLERVERTKLKRIIINVPPGTLKSLLVEVFFPCWVWARDPRKRFLCASYGQHLTTRDNVRSRQILESPWFQSRWPIRMLDDQNTKTRYNTDKSGWRIATSVNGQGVGEHPDFVIIDDPLTPTQAESDVERVSAVEWFDRTISTRLGRNPAIIVIMQRLHQGDLSGHLLHRGGWVHVRWPMRFEKCSCATAPECDPEPNTRCPLHLADPSWKPDEYDPRTTPGELLFPVLFPEEKVKQLELDLGPYGAAGQLQQRPAPEGGGLFKREWFANKFVEKAPTFMRVARGWDTAATEGKGDYTCGCKIGEEFEQVFVNGHRVSRSTGRFFIIDMQRDRLGPDAVDKLILATAQGDGKRCAQREEKEGGSAGKTVVLARTKLLKGFNYAGVQLGGSKVTRAKPFRSQCEGGNVFIVRGAWNDEFLRELCGFPTGTHDDQVDAASCAFNSVLLEEPPRKVRASW